MRPGQSRAEQQEGPRRGLIRDGMNRGFGLSSLCRLFPSCKLPFVPADTPSILILTGLGLSYLVSELVPLFLISLDHFYLILYRFELVSETRRSTSDILIR